MKFKPAMLQVYLVIGTQNVGHQPARVLQVVQQALAAGVTAVQFREKDGSQLDAAERAQLGQAIHQLTQSADVPLLVDDDVQLAEQIGAEGVHVGQTDDTVGPIRAHHPDWIIGLSVHNEAELQASQADLPQVDYLGVGPVFATDSKPDAQAPIGVAGLQAVQAQTELPLVAIGGISENNVHELSAVPTIGVSVISAITQSSDLQKTVQLLKTKGATHEN
ncbi:thiamine phosphate synthase [Fructilactobacillus cliffordii]|uniref:Thiamine-phosphate synthase n=1 Tax=Fructilactobacillus cliffordii TaxID=2940299 RepID=A0A9Q8ZSM7_9LACO|nr:thiamine phosphate synthase [Fructilactobacillus cliffordii]USS88904.1 thiamine phosphate synthase [Fructilactobacillus cliffordii]